MSDNLPVPHGSPASSGGALASAPVPYGGAANFPTRSVEYEAALELKYADPKRYNSPEHQALLLRLAEAKIAAPAADVVAEIERELSAGWPLLQESFSALPASAIAGVEAELIAPLVSNRRASEATLEKWRGDAPLKALLEEWGRDAPRLAARVCERVQRLFYRVDSSSWEVLAAWYDALDGDEAVAVTRALSR